MKNNSITMILLEQNEQTLTFKKSQNPVLGSHQTHCIQIFLQSNIDKHIWNGSQNIQLKEKWLI